MIPLTRRGDRILLPVRVQPGAKRVGVTGEHGGRLRLAVAAPPERGRANAAALDVLADALGVRARELELVSGAAYRNKVVAVTGLDAEALAERLNASSTAPIELRLE